jgi:hypothetical protein
MPPVQSCLALETFTAAGIMVSRSFVYHSLITLEEAFRRLPGLTSPDSSFFGKE